MKVKNMTSNSSGREIANQFIISEEGHGANGNFIRRETFQSYDSIIAIKTIWPRKALTLPTMKEIDIVLDETYWNYSKTTGKYRNQFLNEDKKETEKKIKSGEYRLEDLNK